MELSLRPLRGKVTECEWLGVQFHLIECFSAVLKSANAKDLDIYFLLKILKSELLDNIVTPIGAIA